MKYCKIFLFVLFSNCLMGQNWSSLNGGCNGQITSIFGDTVNNYLYASGFFSEIGGISTYNIAKWNGVTWDSLNGGITHYVPYKAFEVYDSNLVAIGYNILNNQKFYVCKWNGANWDSIGSNFSNDNEFPIKLKVLNNNLYAFFMFDSINGTYYNSIAKWDGISWQSINFPYRYSGATPVIYCMETYNNKIYVGGAFSDSLGIKRCIASYDGLNWEIVGNGFQGFYTAVGDMKVFKNELYVCGSFTQSDGNISNYIARWNDTTWRDVAGSYTGSSIANINSLFVFENKLYVGGAYNEMGGLPINNIATWDGNNWCGLGVSNNGAGVSEITILNNNLYISTANVWSGDTVNGIAKWTGGNYVDTCGNIVSGINEITNQTNFIIYPNPASSSITIESTNTEVQSIKIVDVLGQEIYYIQTQNNKTEIGVSQLPSGIYIVQLQSKKAVVSKKFVKE